MLRGGDLLPVSECVEDCMDDIVEEDDSETDLLLWMSVTWSDRSSNLLLRYLQHFS